MTYTDLRLANQARPDLEEIDVSALVDTGALHLCIPEHVAVQLQLSLLKQREVQTADGKSHLVDYVAPIKISFNVGSRVRDRRAGEGRSGAAWHDPQGGYGLGR